MTKNRYPVPAGNYKDNAFYFFYFYSKTESKVEKRLEKILNLFEHFGPLRYFLKIFKVKGHFTHTGPPLGLD